MNQQDIETGKGLAIVSYITIIGTIIAFFMNNDKKNPFTNFHIRQALGLWLTYFVLAWVVSAFDNWLATFGFWIFFGVLFIYGFINAIGGKAQAVPLLGELFQKWFASIGR
ncbi:hypothetical protein [Snuella sedimenti]|uniref:DUF4870 domain-containing protein n=1 Tax=Snuella sedimenti TaxID=2798802 RepID=A0A8J7J5S4_9FLAO|nr:hypothetical protein [Snuella sedimenti]MBJ6369029.1 hypothetical protein [Snuella sedimenti]